MSEKCDRCNSVGEDRRTLHMSCLYAMNELGLPFKEDTSDGRHFFTLRVCKRCRAEWMAAIAVWFRATPAGQDHDAETPPPSLGSGIFIRENGAVQEISREEWDRRHPGREPYVVTKPEAKEN
jgi:hypothetical protein